jgi:hypothetical protein
MAGRSSSTTTSTCPSISQAHVLEETGSEQRLDRGSRLLVVHGIAYLHRQVGEHGSSFGPLDALDPISLIWKGSKANAARASSATISPASSFLFIWLDEN